MGNMDHNLFACAKPEALQDAFLRWLLSYFANAPKKDPLRACARNLLKSFYPSEVPTRYKYCIITNIRCQYKNIDILVEAHDKLGEYEFIIEDKVNTREHSDQLRRYMNDRKTAAPEKDIYGVYYKSGLQPHLTEVRNAGYTPLTRKDILNILEPYKSIKNDIFQAYYEKLQNDDNEANKYKDVSVKDWSFLQIEKFFYDLIIKDGLNELDYEYIFRKTISHIDLLPRRESFITLEDFGIDLYARVFASSSRLFIDLIAEVHDLNIKDKTKKDQGLKKMQEFIDICIGSAENWNDSVPGRLSLNIKRNPEIKAKPKTIIGNFEFCDREKLSYEELKQIIYDVYRKKMPILAAAFKERESEVFKKESDRGSN